MECYMGLMSGTSMDGIDAALVDFSTSPASLIATYHLPMPEALKQSILDLCHDQPHSLNHLGQIDVRLGHEFANAALALIEQAKVPAKSIIAIGSHGQTIRHMPNLSHPFSLQIADPNVIRARTNITTIADFRRADVAHMGQGAPLTPLFHHWWFAKYAPICIVNVGGMANISLLTPNSSIEGFDTGPGNVLLDGWVQHHFNTPFDKEGELAAQGQVHSKLLAHLLSDPYFQKPPPKSTGREYFNLPWLEAKLSTFGQITVADVQATLLALTANSISQSINQFMPQAPVVVCGGGAHNSALMGALSKDLTVHQSADFGLDQDWVEAMAFAWLARLSYQRQSVNLGSITGSQSPSILGGIYYAH